MEEEAENARFPIGITMGTYQVAGCVLRQRVVNMYFNEDHIELPCCVAFTDTEVLVGKKALDQMEENPENTIYDIKRLLGRYYDDPDIQDYLKEWPFKVIEDNNWPKYQVTYKGKITTFLPEEIMALLFKTVKEHAEFHLHSPVKETVVTVPTQFDSLQRQSTIDAASLAGFELVNTINECTAVAIVYGFLRPQIPDEGDKKIAVISAGCGFLDVSLITYDDRVFECKSNRGSCTMDVNRNMLHHFAGKIQEKHGVDVFSDKTAYVRLWKACEEAKCKMKLERRCPIKVESIEPGVDFEDELTREDLDSILSDLKDTMQNLLDQCLSDIGWAPDSLNEYMMVGGSAEIPCLQNLDVGDSTRTCQILNYPHIYAGVGAAMRVTSLKGGQQMGLQDLIILEISSRTVGIMTREGKCRSFVRHNDNIPHWATQEYTTYSDNEASFHIEIYDGDSKIPSQNKLLGKFCITDFPLRKRGKTHIRVTFQIDTYGQLVVGADDRFIGPTGEPVTVPVTVRNEVAPILREDLPRITQEFHENFPPEPVPYPLEEEQGHQGHIADVGPQVLVDDAPFADVNNEAAHNLPLQNSPPQNIPPQNSPPQNVPPHHDAPPLLVMNGHPEGDNGQLGVSGGGEGGDGGGCIQIHLNTNHH